MKTKLTERQTNTLSLLGVSAQTLTDLISVIPPFARGNFTMKLDDDNKWIVGSMYPEGIFKMFCKETELIDAVYKFLVKIFS